MLINTKQLILSGSTMHWRRSEEANHRFVYPVLFFSLPITDTITTNKLFKHNKFGLYSFFNKDHGNKTSGDDNDLKQWFFSKLAESNQSDKLAKRIQHIQLVSQPRVLGFVFNPVSFWFCFDAHKQLIAVLAEVNNTFGTRFSYLLTLNDSGEITHNEPLYAEKRLYVSPFFEIQGCYQFKFNLKQQKTHITINYFREHSHQQLAEQSKTANKVIPTLVTTLQVNHVPFSQKNLLKSFATFGFSTVLVVYRIHWQAIKLKIKGAQFFSRKKHIIKEKSSVNLAKFSQEIHHETSKRV